MRILQVYARYLERGGEDVVIDQISTRLAGFVELENLQIDTKQWQDECGKGIIGKLRMLLGMYHNPREISRAKEQIANFKPDVILVHNLMPAGSAALLETLLDSGVPVVQYIHNFRPFSVSGYCWVKGKLNDAGLHGNMWPEIISGSWQGSILKTAIYALLLKNQQRKGLYKRIERWIAISPFMKAQFVKAGIASDKICVVPHILEHESSGEELFEVESNNGASKCFIFMGRLIEAKGIKTLLEAWKLLIEKQPDAMLVICGEGPLSDEVTAMSNTLPGIEYLGYINKDEKDRLLKNAIALIVPSLWWEPFGLVVLEAYQKFCPVLAAASGALSELVVDGQTGFLHQPSDHLQLCDQMLLLYSDKDKTMKMGRYGYEFYKQRCQVDIWKQQFMSCMEQSLQK